MTLVVSFVRTIALLDPVQAFSAYMLPVTSKIIVHLLTVIITIIIIVVKSCIALTSCTLPLLVLYYQYPRFSTAAITALERFKEKISARYPFTSTGLSMANVDKFLAKRHNDIIAGTSGRTILILRRLSWVNKTYYYHYYHIIITAATGI